MLGWLILIAVIIIILGLSIRIVPQGSAYVVERLGRCGHSGLHRAELILADEAPEILGVQCYCHL